MWKMIQAKWFNAHVLQILTVLISNNKFGPFEYFISKLLQSSERLLKTSESMLSGIKE